MPDGTQASEPVAVDKSATTRDMDSLLAANLTALPSQLTEHFQHSGNSGVAETTNLALQAADQFYVVFGDGSATSVRLLSKNFSTRGVVLQPVNTLDNPWARFGAPPPDMDDLGNEPSTFDPALLLKVGAAARSLSGARQYQVDEFTMADAPYFLGGGAAGVWGLIGLAKLLRSRRSGSKKIVRTTTRRRL